MEINDLSINDISALAKMAAMQCKMKRTPEQKFENKCQTLYNEISRSIVNTLNGKPSSVYYNLSKFNTNTGSGITRTERPTYKTKVLIPITKSGIELPVYCPLGTTPELKNSRETNFRGFIQHVLRPRNEELAGVVTAALENGKRTKRVKPVVNLRITTYAPTTPVRRKLKRTISDDEDALTPVAQSPASMSPTPLSPISRKPAPGVRPVSPIGMMMKRSTSPSRVVFSPEAICVHSRR